MHTFLNWEIWDTSYAHSFYFMSGKISIISAAIRLSFGRPPFLLDALSNNNNSHIGFFSE